MSSDNHDRSRVTSKNQRQSDAGDGVFDTKKVKKERIDNGENGNSSEQNDAESRERSRAVNGFNSSDLLQDIITAKFSSSPIGLAPAAKNDKIRLMIEDSISDESKSRVQEIFLQVEQLKIEEKLLLYLKLPASLTNPNGTVDPLRQPLNPLGNRYEIHQTIMWIKTHLEEDPDVSLPKQEVYEEYNIFCITNSMKPLSTADFGKVMKQVYPRVRPRRLGTRGNSRYCYAGMRKRVKLDTPSLPAITGTPENDEFDESLSEEMLGAASTLIREWAESTLNHKFPTLSALARHLVDNLYVDTKSLAAVCILCASRDDKTLINKVPETPPIGGKPAKREAQLQLQKKLQQREQKQIKDKAVDNCKVIKGCRKGKTSQSPQTTTPISKTPTIVATTTITRSRKLPRSVNQTPTVLSSEAPPEETRNGSCTPNKDLKPPGKSSRKRASLDALRNSDTSPGKQAKLGEEVKKVQRGGKVSVIPTGNLKIKSETKVEGEPVNGRSSAVEATEDSKDQVLDRNDKLCKIDPDELDDYLNGGNNSQEPEEELLQYFQQSSSSSSDVEVNPIIGVDTDQVSRSDKVSQLRLILQQNLKATVRPADLPVTPQQPAEKIQTQKHDANTNQSRRRVSFETSVVEHIQESNPVNTIPQSPNTRRRIFNFTPISPGPHSPINGRAASKPNSANASPFVSPRNTPVPRSRSNMAGICRSRKQFSRSISCSAPFINNSKVISDNNNFVVPTSSGTTTVDSRQLTTTAATSLGDLIGCPNKDIDTIKPTLGPDNKTNPLANCTTSFLSSDVNPQKQLLINYPSQENLQEIKNVNKKYVQQDQEISDLFNSVKPFGNEHLYRSQSVPIHRMINPTLMSPLSNNQPYQPYNFNNSSNSSIAPTPVPSEFNDFGSIGQPDTYLLDEVDANLIDDQPFMMGDKDISSENITKILNFLDEDDGKGLHILPDQPPDESLIDTTSLILDPNTNLNISQTLLDPSAVLDPSVGESLRTIIQTRSYPNTPLPHNSYPPAFTEDSNGSRSYPSTPLIQSQEIYRDEPMLSSPTLNSLNLRSEGNNQDSSENVCRNVTDLLETNFLGDNETDADDLDQLGNFEDLQDVDSLAPLFNEVSDNR